MTDVDRRSAGRLMASTALLKNLIFIKCFGFSAGTSKYIYEYVIRTTEFIIRMKKCFDQNENNLMRMKFC